jgi:hypothetical protein
MKRIAIAVAVAALAAPVAGHAATSTTSSKASPTHAAIAQREVRIVGKVTKLTALKITVANSKQSKTFRIPVGFNLGGVMVGDRVEAEGERAGGVLTLRSIHREDRVAVAAAAARHGADDPAGHDAGDDHGHDGGGHH